MDLSWTVPTDDVDGLPAAVRGGLGFLSRVPVGAREDDWAAFRTTPLAFPLVGYLVGVLIALPIAIGTAVGVPVPSVAAAAVAWLYLVVGINHVDGLADLGDAAAVHGGPKRRLDVLGDTTVGVGAVLVVGVVIAGLALAMLTIAALPLRALGIVVAAEVGAKLGMVTVAAFGTDVTDGLGAELSGRVGPTSLVLPIVVSLPAVALTWSTLASGAALVVSVVVGIALGRWARGALGGVNGDVMGAANEVGRVAGLHAGVIVWTLS